MRPERYKQYLLFLLAIIFLFNCIERVVLGLMLEDIKLELELTDTQLGLLSGIAFALFYSFMGVPIARWADRGNRVLIICLTAILWSVAVALCGLAAGFVQLMLIRVFVAVGEAGCVPPAFSLLADYFKRSERPRAIALYGLGGSLSGMVGYLLGGWLIGEYGWRMTFMVMGPPGLLLAAIAWFTLREPRNDVSHASHVGARQSADELPHQPTLQEVARTLWRNSTFRHLVMCVSVLSFFNYGIYIWQAAFFMRSYGMETGQLGFWLAMVAGAGTLTGSYLCAVLATRYAANNERLQMFALAIATAVCGILNICTYLSPNAPLALTLQGFVTLGLMAANGPLFATIQTLVPDRMRAVALALVYLVSNLVGLGFGPLAAGALSDAFGVSAGVESLRYALLSMSPGYFWAAWHAWRASRTVVRDLAHMQSADLAAADTLDVNARALASHRANAANGEAQASPSASF